jgi:hypothetical protein
MTDPAEHDQQRTRESALSGGTGVPAPRSEIAASWRRVAAAGLDPGDNPAVPPLSGSELERRRTESEIAPLLPQLNESLKSVVEAGQLVVVTDAEGRVLWRTGSKSARRMADRLGFVAGSAWTEGNVGTNAIGISLVTGEPVQIRGAEHFVESHTRWGCAAAPLSDPWTGRFLGVLDVSGPSRTLHPAELGLVTMAARLSALEVLDGHRAALDRLRAVAVPMVSRVGGRALVVDRAGRTALAVGLEPPSRVALPSAMSAGEIWVPTLGAAQAEALPGGWLLRLGAAEASPTALLLDLTRTPTVTVTGESGEWARELSPRHAEILLALLQAGSAGRTAGQLAADLFADPGRVVTVRAEMSRLRRALGTLLLAQPYRLAPAVLARLELPQERTALLPASNAPVVVALRQRGGGDP